MTKSLLTRRRILALTGMASVVPPVSAVSEEAPSLPERNAPFDSLRRRFYLPERSTFLNTGALGACSDYVLDRAARAWRRLEAAPVYEGYGPLAEEADRVRGRVARFLGCHEDEVALTTSTTDGMNLIAEGLDLQRGDRVLTTDQEHAGGSVCWQHYAERRGVVVDRLPLGAETTDRRRIVELFSEGLHRKTRVVSLSEVTYTTGLRLPVEEIAALATAAGALLVVDGAQSIGALDVDVTRLGCHAWAGSGHKWLTGPKGTGILYLRRDAQKLVRPLRLTEGYGVYTDSTGVPGLPGIIGLGAAVEFVERLGIDRIASHNLELRNSLYNRLGEETRLPRLGPLPTGPATGMLSFTLPDDVDAQELRIALHERHGVRVKRIPPEQFNGLRVAFHLYNSEEDGDRLMAALRHELGPDLFV